MAATVKPQVVPEGAQMSDDASEDGELRDESPKPAQSSVTKFSDEGGLEKAAAGEDGMEEGELELEEGEIAPESPPPVRGTFSIAPLVIQQQVPVYVIVKHLPPLPLAHAHQHSIKRVKSKRWCSRKHSKGELTIDIMM